MWTRRIGTPSIHPSTRSTGSAHLRKTDKYPSCMRKFRLSIFFFPCKTLNNKPMLSFLAAISRGRIYDHISWQFSQYVAHLRPHNESFLNMESCPICPLLEHFGHGIFPNPSVGVFPDGFLPPYARSCCCILTSRSSWPLSSVRKRKGKIQFYLPRGCVAMASSKPRRQQRIQNSPSLLFSELARTLIFCRPTRAAYLNGEVFFGVPNRFCMMNHDPFSAKASRALASWYCAGL